MSKLTPALNLLYLFQEPNFVYHRTVNHKVASLSLEFALISYAEKKSSNHETDEEDYKNNTNCVK